MNKCVLQRREIIFFRGGFNGLIFLNVQIEKE